jgi:hypothetical protein
VSEMTASEIVYRPFTFLSVEYWNGGATETRREILCPVYVPYPLYSYITETSKPVNYPDSTGNAVNVRLSGTFKRARFLG